ncbi:MAG: dihydrofolate synthase / folylpolyglutamate synthase [Solirubrobacteraceae bacterium]|jgi:dihydrofolate synthase/folylpolyglutamate synthase|nr:dihydrofolate synthase / folylpolyglutamate synthase [Solirubrobacteraceae bacterium]
MALPRQSAAPARFTEEQAEAKLRSLELFGMRFGLDRMRRMMTVLGSPERRFQTVQVLGTNGKSSTTRMLAAILERHGLRTGAYLSPHLVSYRERVRIGEREIDAEHFAAAIARAAWAAERVNRTLGEGDHVTQFELLTAAALWQMAESDVEVAVIEAGLGGRYDATSVIEPRVSVLTNVGLEHTRWLGPTLKDIAEEKLAALRPGATLVLGADLVPAAREVAERAAARCGARILDAGAPAEGLLRARGSFQRRNFALAHAAAGAYLHSAGIALREQALAEAAAAVEVPGRLQLLAGEPLTILDGAHNPDAVAALLEALPEVLEGGPLALVLGVLEDKDASAMLAPLLPLCERAWFTAPPSPRALPPAALASLARQLGFSASTCEPAPARALEHARRWAREHGGAVLATGSVYLVGDLLDSLGLVAAPNSGSAPANTSSGNR